jgi:UDP:flavonoid glycosyltransferase YjiC (YdhE family)
VGGRPLPDWWPGNRDPLVYVTFGSVAGRLGLVPGVYRAAVEALSDLPVRVLVTTGQDSDPAELDPLPPNAHAERWVPQAGVTPHADAVVCHGGYGSMLGSLAYGLPLALLPLFGGDQWHNARRVAQVGAGVALEGADAPERAMFDPPGPDAMAALPAAVGQLLDEPSYRRAAAQIADDIEALPPVDAAADAVRTREVARGV